MGPLGELFLSPERRAGRRREVVLRARRDLQEKVQALRQAADALQALAGREPDTLSAPEARRLSGLDAAAERARRALSPPRPAGPSPRPPPPTPGGEPDPA
jgi:hypothetical protein